MFSGTEKYKEVIFEGKIRYFNKFYDIAEACENLVAMVEAVDENKKVPVAFDMEWPYDVKKKISGKTSLIQICMDIDECFLFHLPLLSKLPASLSIFLNHPRVILHGVNIVEDVKKLGKDFPYFNTDSMFNNCLDLRTWYYEVTSHQIRSMKFLVKHALKKDINKSLQISSWQEVPLNEAQMKYAATDVFVSFNFNSFHADYLILYLFYRSVRRSSSEFFQYKISTLRMCRNSLSSLAKNWTIMVICLEKTFWSTKWRKKYAKAKIIDDFFNNHSVGSSLILNQSFWTVF